MPSFLFMGKAEDEFDGLFFVKFYGAMQSLRLRDDDAVVNVVKNYKPILDSKGIIATGYSSLECPPDQKLFSKIQHITGLPVFQVPSVCNTVGVARVQAPYLEVFVSQKEIKEIIKKLREIKVFWDVEFHIIDTNTERRKDKFCVKVNILEREIMIASNIIQHLREIGLKKDQIWINIIHEFVSAKRLQQIRQ
jgi:hypothetical protein